MPLATLLSAPSSPGPCVAPCATHLSRCVPVLAPDSSSGPTSCPIRPAAPRPRQVRRNILVTTAAHTGTATATVVVATVVEATVVGATEDEAATIEATTIEAITAVDATVDAKATTLEVVAMATAGSGGSMRTAATAVTHTQEALAGAITTLLLHTKPLPPAAEVLACGHMPRCWAHHLHMAVHLAMDNNMLAVNTTGCRLRSDHDRVLVHSTDEK